MIKFNLPIFKIRASSASRILTTPDSYLMDWALNTNFSSKYTEKGIFCEDEAIKFLSKLDGVNYKKNKRHYQDAFMTGSPDIKTDEYIIDTKCSWSIPSFNKQKTLTKAYWWQLQVYMHLLKIPVGFVKFVGIDTPIRLLTPDDVIADHQFSHLPDEERVITFRVDYDPKSIEELKVAVLNCRGLIKKKF